MTCSLSVAMRRYFIELRTRKYIKGYGFLSFARELSKKYGKQFLDTGLDALKTATKKVAHKAAKAIGEFLGHKIANKVAGPAKNSKKSWRNNYSIRNKRRNIEWIKASIVKMEHHRISISF